MAILAQHRAANLWLERDSVVPAAVVTNDLKSRRSIVPHRRFFRTAPRAPLGRHHIPLVKKFLIFFAENKDLFTLHTRDIDIWHSVISFTVLLFGCEESLAYPALAA